MLYFHFVPSPEKVSLAKFFPERGGQTKDIIPCSCNADPGIGFVHPADNLGLANALFGGHAELK